MNAKETLMKVRLMLNEKFAKETAKLEDGTEINFEILEVGKVVYVNETPMTAGEYKLEDGRILVIAEDGTISEILEAGRTKEMEETTETTETTDTTDTTETTETVDKVVDEVVEEVVTVVDIVEEAKTKGEVPQEMIDEIEKLKTTIEEMNKKFEELIANFQKTNEEKFSAQEAKLSEIAKSPAVVHRDLNREEPRPVSRLENFKKHYK